MRFYSIMNSLLVLILSLLIMMGCKTIAETQEKQKSENYQLESLTTLATTKILENKHGEFRFGGYILFDAMKAQPQAMPEYKFKLETLELDWIENEELGENTKHICYLGRTFDKIGWNFAGNSKSKKKILQKAAIIPRTITPGSGFAILIEKKSDGSYDLWYKEEQAIIRP